VQDAIQSVVLGQAPAADALSKANDQVNALLK
jgi:multiple sugar transport system substrate-binding protein